MRKGNSIKYFKPKQRPIMPVFKKMSYLQPNIPKTPMQNKGTNQIKANTTLNNNYHNNNPKSVNASDAMPHFYGPNHLVHNHISKPNTCNRNSKSFSNDYHHQQRFKSHYIADKEISMIKSNKNNSSYMEALVNKSIDNTAYQFSTLLGKSMLDFSLSHSKSKNERTIDRDIRRPVYTTSDNNEKQSDSSINFKFGTEPIAVIPISNMLPIGISPIKHKQDSLSNINQSKVNASANSKAQNDKPINQKKRSFMMKEQFINLKSLKKNNSQSKTVTNTKTKTNPKPITNEIIKANYEFHNCNDYEEEKEEVYPFAKSKYESNSTSKDKLINNEGYSVNCNNGNANDIVNKNIKTIDINPQYTNHPKSKGDDDDDDNCNIEDNSFDASDSNSIQPSQVYQSKPITTMNDIIIKSDIHKTDPSNQYNSIIHKYLFTDNESKDNNISNSLSNSLNESHLSQIDKDFNEITSVKERMMKIEQYYSNQISKMHYEMNRLDTSKSMINFKEDDSILLYKPSNTINNNKETQERNIKGILSKLDTLEQSLSKKEDLYKTTIQYLIEELKDSSKTGVVINDALLKEANDFLNEDDYIIKAKYNGYTHNGISGNGHGNNQYQNKVSIDIQLTTELERFKKEEALYTFDISPKYQFSNRVKCIKEKVIKGKLVRFYDNNVIDVIDKKKTLKRIFPDGYEIWYYSNKDIQQKCPDGRLLFYYHKNKSYEFRYLNEKFLVYKFSSGQYEKHYFDNAKSIKFADGSYRITRLNGEELIQFNDGTIQLIGKNDKVNKLK